MLVAARCSIAGEDSTDSAGTEVPARMCVRTHVCVVCKRWDVEQTSAADLPLTIWEALRTVPTWRGLIYSNLLKCSVLAASPMWSCCTVSNFPLALLLLNFKGINSSPLKNKCALCSTDLLVDVMKITVGSRYVWNISKVFLGI